MDPLTAISLAGTVVQFVDFSCKLIRLSSELYENSEVESYASNTLSTQMVQSLAIGAIKDLDEYKMKIRQGLQGTQDHRLAEDETELRNLCAKCNRAAETLLSRLYRLKVSKFEKKLRWKSLQHALLIIWNKDEIEQLSGRLAEYRSAIGSKVLLSLGKRINFITVQQSNYFRSLSSENQLIITALLKVQKSLDSDLRIQITALSQILDRTALLVADQEDRTRRIIVDVFKDLLVSDQTKGNLEKRSVIRNLKDTETSIRSAVKNEIINSLLFPTITERFDDVIEAHSTTFQWVFQHHPEAEVQVGTDKMMSNFPRWLREGAGIYWISGKAASGKSTLMKYICTNPDTRLYLQKWSDQSPIQGPLYVASFYFWISGTREQKSQLGLMKTLLYSILEQNPELVPVVFPTKWSARYTGRLEGSSAWQLFPKRGTWSLSELKTGFKALLEQDQIPFKLCMFIDGLDEYKGDEHEIAELFGEISRSPYVKCCVSSRPHLAFHDAFQGLPGLRLEDLTYSDIERYVIDKLQNDRRMQRLAALEPEETTKLIEDIVTFADGVFLWVKLVIVSLLKGLGNRDQISDLRARLDALPRDLVQLYQLMISRVDESYREEASRLFQLVDAAAEERPDNWHNVRPLTILGLALAEEKDPDLVFTARTNFLSLQEANNLCERMRDRVTSRCGGLLEVQRPLRDPKLNWTMKVRYMHRTAGDYLMQDETRALLRGRTGSQMSLAFNTDLVLLRSYILHMKVVANFSPMYPWDFVTPAITFARRTDADEGPCRIKLLDELYYVSSSLGKKYKEDETSILRNQSTPHTFAVECGLHKYLSAKLKQDNVVHQTFGNKTLLQLALCQEAEYSKHFMSSKVVATLLSYGADPRKCRRAWSDAVWRITQNEYHLDEQEAKQWARIIGDMFQAGLRPTSMDVQLLTQAFRPYPELWGEVQSGLMKEDYQPTIDKPSPRKQSRKRDRCRLQ